MSVRSRKLLARPDPEWAAAMPPAPPVYAVCHGCRRWVDAIYYISPGYPRSHLCLECATAIGQGPKPREAGHGQG